jgi:hypothetical protein
MAAESIDWSDPSKLVRRDGGEVLACGKNEGLSGPQACWAVTRSSSGEPPTLDTFGPRESVWKAKALACLTSSPALASRGQWKLG